MTSSGPAPLPAQQGRARPRAGRIVRRSLSAVLILGLGASGLWALSHQQRVSDQFVVWQFEPSAAVSSLAQRSTMTEEGRFLFYASRPSIEAHSSFERHCASQAENVGILGCYVHGVRQIYLFEVSDGRLDGLAEVVAAHEMLHAAWDRMSSTDRATIAPLLETEAAARAGDPAFVKTLEYYAATETGQRLNELHSIIATEFADISPGLEKYYSAYFSDRAALIALHTSSEAVFTERQATVAAILVRISDLKVRIDTDYASYNSGYDSLNSDIATFNARADHGGEFTQRQFTTQRDQLVTRQDELDAFYISIGERVTQYDSLVTQLDVLNAEVATLNESINIQPRTKGDS